MSKEPQNQLHIDLSVILGATIGAMIRAGMTPDEVRRYTDIALTALEG